MRLNEPKRAQPPVIVETPNSSTMNNYEIKLEKHGIKGTVEVTAKDEQTAREVVKIATESSESQIKSVARLFYSKDFEPYGDRPDIK